MGLLKGMPAEGWIREFLFFNFHIGKHVYWAKHITAGLNMGGIPGPFAFVACIRVHSSPGSQVAPRRAAKYTDPVRVNLILAGMGAEKADSGLDVNELVREMPLGAAAIVHGGHHVACVGEFRHLTQHHIFIRSAPAASGNPEQGRLRAVILLGVILAGGQAHFAVSILQKNGHFELQRLSLQILYSGKDNIVDQCQGFLLKPGINGTFHKWYAPFYP